MFFFQNFHVRERAFHHAFGRRVAAGTVQNVLRERPRIDADANRYFFLARHVDDADDVFPFPDIPRIDAEGVDTGFHGGQRQAVIEMDIGDEGDAGQRFDVANGFGSFFVRHGNAHDVGTGRAERIDLGRAARRIDGAVRAHGLDGDGRPTADGDACHADLSRLFHFINLVMSLAVPKRNRPSRIATPTTWM